MISSSSSVQGVCCVCGWVGNEGEREKRGVFGRRYGRWSLSTFCLLLKKGNDAAATRALFSLLLYPVDVGPQLVVPPFPALLAHSTREVDGQVGPAALAPLLDEAGWMKRREKGGVFIYIYIFLMINVKKDAFGGRRKQWSACPSLPILVYANFQLATGAGMMARAGSSGRGSHPDKKRGSAQTSARPGAGGPRPPPPPPRATPPPVPPPPPPSRPPFPPISPAQPGIVLRRPWVPVGRVGLLCFAGHRKGQGRGGGARA